MLTEDTASVYYQYKVISYRLYVTIVAQMSIFMQGYRFILYINCIGTDFIIPTRLFLVLRKKMLEERKNVTQKKLSNLKLML